MALPKVKGKDLAALRAAHDENVMVPKRIEKALAELGDSWEYEKDFISRTGVSSIKLAHFRPKYSEFFFEVSQARNAKRVWCGTKAFARKCEKALQGGEVA